MIAMAALVALGNSGTCQEWYRPRCKHPLSQNQDRKNLTIPEIWGRPTGARAGWSGIPWRTDGARERAAERGPRSKR